MKRTFSLLLIASLLLVVPAHAQNGVGACPFNASALTSAYKEMITVSTTALPFTASTYRPSTGSPPAVCATLMVNTNSISWWSNGSIPTASDGIISGAGQSVSVGSSDLAKFRMIRAGASDAEVAVLYFIPVQ